MVSDLLIRDVPDDVLAALDARAKQLGLSRAQYLRRRLAQDAAAASSPVTARDLQVFGETFADLADDAVMASAWE